MMKWKKGGWIYQPTGECGYDVSHCHKPTPLQIDEDTVRVYFGVRDSDIITRSTFIDLDANDLQKVKYIHRKPIVDIGAIGTFDDRGAQVCSVVRHEGRVYLYYIGWNTSTTVPSRNALGLAISDDGGTTFERVYEGPIVERYQNEAYHIGASDVIYDEGQWKMWYNCGVGFKVVAGHPEYRLHIKYATSDNGIDWKRHNISCIVPESETEIIGRGAVLKDDAGYHMWYSRRSIVDFRTNPKNSYRVGYADSADGITWTRKDDESNLETSPNPDDWDSQMVAYPYVIDINGRRVMFYNGNGFGKTGLGYAVLES